MINAVISSPVYTYTEPYARTAQQIAAAYLPFGWSLDWNTVDWLIPGGGFTVERATPIDIVKRLAGVVRAVVLPDATADTVIVAPSHAISSWDWGSETPYSIPQGAVLYSQYAANPTTAANAVYLSATRNGGVQGRVKRTGTAGNLVAPDLSDALFTHADAIREAGRLVLSEAGRIGYQTVELPLAESPNHPHLLALGSFVEVNDGHEIFIGQVTQLKIDISFGSMPKQTATIARYA